MMVIKEMFNYTRYQLRKLRRNYNVIERSEKLLDKEKQAVAPRHPGTARKFQTVIKSSPEAKEEMFKKSEDLISRMRKITIDSTEEISIPKDREGYPQRREYKEVPEFGYEEPSHIPKGKCSLRQALIFILSHENEPDKWTMDMIAEKYNMNKADIENIISNFSVFGMYTDHLKNKKSKFSQDLATLGVGSVTAPSYKKKFEHLEGVEKDDMYTVKKVIAPTETSKS